MRGKVLGPLWPLTADRILRFRAGHDSLRTIAVMPRDHYVPRFYLANFASQQEGHRDPAFWVYDKDEAEPRLQTPENTAVRHDYYTFKAPTGGESRAVEEMLGDIEGATKPIVDRWLAKGARPEGNEIAAFVPFLAFAYTRVPRQAEPSKQVAQAMGMELVRYWLDNPDAPWRLPEGTQVCSFKGTHPSFSDSMVVMRGGHPAGREAGGAGSPARWACAVRTRVRQAPEPTVAEWPAPARLDASGAQAENPGALKRFRPIA